MVDRELAGWCERTEAEGFFSLLTAAGAGARSAAGVHTTRIAGAPVWRCDGIQRPLFNRTIAFGLYEDLSLADLDALNDFYENRPHAVEASPSVALLSKGEMRSRGYQVAVIRPKFVRSAEPRESPHGTQTRVAEPSDSEEFARVIVTSFGLPAVAEELVRSIVETSCPGRACVLATIDGAMAGVGFLFVKDGVGWLGGGCCLPEFRGRGVQRALIEGRSAIAREMGAEWVTAETSPDTAGDPGYSMRNMLKCGFEHVFDRPQYCKE